jgi:hypothetical protein
MQKIQDNFEISETIAALLLELQRFIQQRVTKIDSFASKNSNNS